MQSTPPHRPFVWVNCAVSVDGRLALAGGHPAQLSGRSDMRRVQELRANSDGILVGVGTVILDDPSLRVHWELIGRPPGRTPVRIILDSRGRIPPMARVLDGTLPTIVATTTANAQSYPAGVELIQTRGTRVDLPELFAKLKHRGMDRLLVEGGSEVLASVLRTDLWDRFTVYVASMLIGGTTAPSLLAGPETTEVAAATPMVREGVVPLDDGVLLSYRPRPPGRLPE